MKILNFGSLNMDHVYSVDHFVRPGETLSSHHYQKFSGGKGLNQSIALARAGAQVFHAGKVGEDGIYLKDLLAKEHVDVGYVQVGEGPTGHAIIQVKPDGENCIILHGGANQQITTQDLSAVLADFSRGDILLLQNEMNSIPEILTRAQQKGMTVVFNPAPMSDVVQTYPLEFVDWLIVNRVEASDLSGKKEKEEIILALIEKFPRAQIIFTLGENGVIYFGKDRERVFVPGQEVKALDTTAAGDTFIGYFLANLVEGLKLPRCLEWACMAAAICVTREGAANSIPRREEVRCEK